MKLPKRKSIRLKNYDYSQNGAYFVTICTHNRECLLCEIVGAPIGRPSVRLSPYGKIVEIGIQNIQIHYNNVKCEKYIIMPNHIHLIIEMCQHSENGRPMVAPTLAGIINQMKGYISKQIGQPIWQKGYHEHIIRNEKEYQRIWEYIDHNPQKWVDDCYHKKYDDIHT